MTSFSAVGAQVVALGPSWLDPQNLLQTFGTAGFWIAVGIIFAECGLLIGFFLPGDSLLFIVGLAIAAGWVNVNLFLALALLFRTRGQYLWLLDWRTHRAGPLPT